MGTLDKTLGLGLGLGLALTASAGCDFEGATGAEIREAMDEIVLTGQAGALENGVVEITTSFTLGEGVETILEEVRSFAQSQVACSTIESPKPGTLVIDFGELGDLCQYRGKTYAGVVTVSWELGDDAVIVRHDYDGLTDGFVTLDGPSTVTWADASRRVQTDFTFENDRTSIEIASDRTQTLLGGLGDGINVVGTRDWTSPRGAWALDIDDVEMRAIDPVPQAGSYTLTTPQEHELTLSFERVDDNTIEVSITGGRRDRLFHVTSSGEVEEE
ncbi:MAG: hypothetical protein KUG77_23665 [Nannocystaceae bacterium]|nr:hypothetical protein [Nannocystaceae bacterium]